MAKTNEHILCSVEEGIMQITLSRPAKLNAYTAIVGAELAEAFDAADTDDAVRVVLVTGAGRGFCAGADMSAGAGAFDTSSAAGRRRSATSPGAAGPAARAWWGRSMSAASPRSPPSTARL